MAGRGTLTKELKLGHPGNLNDLRSREHGGPLLFFGTAGRGEPTELTDVLDSSAKENACLLHKER